MDTFKNEGMENPMQAKMPQVNTPIQESNGSALAIIIVILIIAIGGAYFWYSRAAAPVVKAPVIVRPTALNVSKDALNKDLQSSTNIDITADINSIDSIYEGK